MERGAGRDDRKAVRRLDGYGAPELSNETRREARKLSINEPPKDVITNCA